MGMQDDDRWAERLELVRTQSTSDTAKSYLNAHVEMIGNALCGAGPEGPNSNGGGARIVANISNAHIGSFCRSSYKNGYDLGKLRIGAAPDDVSRRERLDIAISRVANCQPQDIYYAAVELNGTGVRFYGDMCLVLKEVASTTHVLDRNSYDLMRPPRCTTFDTSDDDLLASEVKTIAGTWATDLRTIAAIKVLATPRATERRMTTGQISQGLLSDEDYVEVILTHSFQVGDLHEVRVHADDAAKEEYIARRESTGPMPPAASSLWFNRRRTAEADLAGANVSLRVVTDAGRVRS